MDTYSRRFAMFWLQKIKIEDHLNNLGRYGGKIMFKRKSLCSCELIMGFMTSFCEYCLEPSGSLTTENFLAS
jgi:hypothetical protein